MSETPSIDPSVVQNTLAEKIEAQESLKDSKELDKIKAEGSIAQNVDQLHTLLTAQTAEDGSVEAAEEVAAEKAALQAAITETAQAHADEGVTETLIMLWINGEQVATGLEGLQERGIKTYQELLADEEAIKTIQQIGVDLGLDLSTENSEDGVDGKYGAKTRAAWEEVQQALVNAGYNLGEFGENNDGVDGAVGEVTMNVLLQAARGVAPDDVVEVAAQEAAAPAAAETARLESVTAAMRPEGREGEYTPEDRADIGRILAEDHPGITYADGVFTHKIGGENATRAAHEIFGTNIGSVDPAEARQKLATFNTEQITAFAEQQGGRYAPSHPPSNTPVFLFGEGVEISAKPILESDDPTAALRLARRMLKESPSNLTNEERQIETTFLQQAPLIPGVRTVSEENRTISLFGGEPVSLDTIYSTNGGVINLDNATRALQDMVNDVARAYARANNATFTPYQVGPPEQPAYFIDNESQSAVFTLNEITKGEIDLSITLPNPHPERQTVLNAHLLALGERS